MKKHLGLTMAVGLLLMASGCSAPDDTAAPAVTSEEPAATSAPAPTIDPGPVALTTAEAAERYLQITCDRNRAARALNDGFVVWEETYTNSGSPDLEEVRATAGEGLTASHNAVVLYDDPYFEWPEAVAANVLLVRDATLAEVPAFDSIKNASTYDHARNVIFPDSSAASAAAQEVRLALGISPDTTASCIGHEGAQDLLLAEKEEREAALSDPTTGDS